MEKEKKKKKIEKEEEKERKKQLKKAEKLQKKEERKNKIQEEKNDNNKRKIIKIKKKPLFIIIFLLLIAIPIISVIAFKQYEKSTVRSIKRNFYENVITSKTTKLYNKKHQNIGTISKGYELKLERIKKYSYSNRYLKIKDSNYYIYYKGVKKDKNKSVINNDTYYLPLEKEISSTSSTVLYDNNYEMVTLKNGIKKITVLKEDDKNYYISFLGKTLRLPKSNNIKENTIKQSKNDNKAKHVSVIYYDKIKNECAGDDTCLKPVSVKAHINLLKENGYYFITKDDYVNYINKYINLKEKAVFITTGEINEEVNTLNKELNINISKIEDNDSIKFNITNKASTPDDSKESINCYQAKSYTIIDKYLSMAEGITVEDNGKETSDNQSIAVLNYHFFYDVTKGEYEWCQETICLEKQKFREHLDWLKNNNYKTLTIKEFADWMDGIIELPEKSVLITIDDGARGTGKHNGDILIPLLEEYKMHATLFLIAGWWDISNYQSPYLDVQSHSFNLHYEASCRDGRGMVACSDYATVKADLQQSLDIIKDNTSFCFPFYSYDNESLQAIKELGFRVSFIGGSVKARRSNNHYLVPRYPILSDITLNQFIRMVS